MISGGCPCVYSVVYQYVRECRNSTIRQICIKSTFLYAGNTREDDGVESRAAKNDSPVNYSWPGWLCPVFFLKFLYAFIFYIVVVGNHLVDNSARHYLNYSVGNCSHQLMIVRREQDNLRVFTEPVVE